MNRSVYFMACIRLLCVLAFSGLVTPVSAEDAREVSVSALPGTSVIVDTVGCALNPSFLPPSTVEVLAANGRRHIVFTSVQSQRAEVQFTVDVGSMEAADGRSCVGVVSRRYTVALNTVPEISPASLQMSFQVLIAALILALLLESAFALIFNWRIFNYLLVRKSVQPIVMLVGALIIVRAFGFDLIAQLYKAYYPAATVPQNGWGTSVLTAMILAGGSSGINQILKSLGFRSPLVRPDVEPVLREDQAWVSVEVLDADQLYTIDVSTIQSASSPFRVAGTVGPKKRSVGAMFFPNQNRIPSSGGMVVSTNDTYVITARCVKSGEVIDVFGKVISDISNATPIAFAPKAVVDFQIPISK